MVCSLHLHRMLHDDMRESGLLPVLAKLVKDFSARRSSRVYAADLVAALHSTMRLLTRLSLSGAPSTHSPSPTAELHDCAPRFTSGTSWRASALARVLASSVSFTTYIMMALGGAANRWASKAATDECTDGCLWAGNPLLVPMIGCWWVRQRKAASWSSGVVVVAAGKVGANSHLRLPAREVTETWQKMMVQRELRQQADRQTRMLMRQNPAPTKMAQVLDPRPLLSAWRFTLSPNPEAKLNPRSSIE